MKDFDIAAAHAFVDEIAALLETVAHSDVSDSDAASRMLIVMRRILDIDELTKSAVLDGIPDDHGEFLLLLRHAAQATRGRLAGTVSMRDWMASAVALASWPHDTRVGQ